MGNPDHERISLSTDLLHFYDDFTELQDYCAFLCDAFGCLATSENSIDPVTAAGISHFSQRVKSRMHELKKELSRIRQKADYDRSD